MSFPTASPASAEALPAVEADFHLHRFLTSLTDAYAIHKALAEGIPKSAGRVLWRDERLPDGVPYVLVQTERSFVWGEAVGLRPLALNKPVRLALEEGMVLRFRLRGNPVRRNSRERPREVCLRDPEEARRWFLRKAEESGFVPRALRLHVEPRLPGKPGAVHCPVLYEGVLEVVDPARLKEAVQRGVGRAKYAGFGLLSLAPAREWG